MSYAEDLLIQARHLAAIDTGIPAQANLRRAVSAAYYSLFHLFTGEASDLLSPASPRALALRVARAFSHAEMRQVCSAIAVGSVSKALKELQPRGFSEDLKRIPVTFVELQDARHVADYDLSAYFTRPEAIVTIDLAGSALATWQTVRDSEEANVFLTALLLNGRWSK